LRFFSVFALVSLLAACRGRGTPDDPNAVDADGDGVVTPADCNDADPTVHPWVDEICNGVDDNCNDQIDEEDTNNANTWYADTDGDGFGDPNATAPGCAAPAGFVADNTDCDDADAAFHPGALENDCSNPVDYNCDVSSLPMHVAVPPANTSVRSFFSLTSAVA